MATLVVFTLGMASQAFACHHEGIFSMAIQARLVGDGHVGSPLHN